MNTTTWTVSATTRDASPEPVEMPWTRQTVPTEAQAQALCIARNRGEQRCNGTMVWGYYANAPATPAPAKEVAP